ncbi:TrkH family potassium uptake protein [Corynebacterium sanguinis]|uniref:TrkH family potassium uptake protein n=1 Tax=Corynebacterium sanguinis TaxID=2594913 RepID=A0A6C1TUR1_9CORY|nr:MULTISPECIES: potassium transporter TrkG [Corynebacterium]MBA4505915.1 TrkH family potassium uptake protein [Corynebacterium sanguinis]TVS24874.1 TrkH family potassium uptake protein [Corynebacterium sanguinis]TVS25069.1 TrkH family potassium uptake protein [Corynebacterium sanguinis]TVS26433.1 TrkH family potassium uptake protein [Corynebacterium sanguinis]WNI13976.1 potassium transporter TrkG [Corynebacterium sp. Z-1]
MFRAKPGLRYSLVDKSRPVGLFEPARLTAVVFLALILTGTLLLMMPFSTAGPQWAPFLPSLFTATSAVSLTGLTVVDTGTYWTPLGQGIILALIQLGGLGIMSLASLSGLILTGRVSFRARQTGAAEGRPVTQGGIRRTLVFTVAFTLVVELLVAVILTLRFMVSYDQSFSRAVWEGVFHSVSAFNNAGFSTNTDNLVPFAADAWVLMPLAAALIGGGLGFPVWAELVRLTRRSQVRVHRISITARMTLAATVFLLFTGAIFMAFAEWNGVFGDMPVWQRVLNAFFASATSRTAGFNTFDYGEAHPITLMGTDILMFIGGGSAGTAGGVKVTTACVLIAAMAAEFLGREDTSIGHRTLPRSVTRQSLALAFAGVAVVTAGIGALRIFDPQFSGDEVSFEVMSAFATVGLSTGITAELSAPSQVILCLIMYLGRVGPTTLIAALAATAVSRRFRYPEERPFIG